MRASQLHDQSSDFHGNRLLERLFGHGERVAWVPERAIEYYRNGGPAYDSADPARSSIGSDSS
jgi:hypothetical protein